MKRKVITTMMLTLTLFLAITALNVAAIYAGGEGTFGGYVRTLAKAGVPDCLNALGLDFGAIFVSPTSGTPQPISEHEHTGGVAYTQSWCASLDLDGDGHPDYAAQWFKAKTGWGIPEHDYVLIWSHGAPIPGYPDYNQRLNFDEGWVKDLHEPDVPIADHGVYYVYWFDVTG